MPFEIIRNDITKMKVDAIVCNGNRRLERSGGVSGAVFEAAGPKLTKYCADLPGCDNGAAVVTPGFDLPAKYIIHTVGPHWRNGEVGEEEILRTCYRNVLNAARKNLCQTVAIPLIASGLYGFPKTLAMRIATEEINAFVGKHGSMTVYLVVYGPEAFGLGKELQEDIKEYITNDQYRDAVDLRISRYDRHRHKIKPLDENGGKYPTGPGFHELLFEYVEASGRPWRKVYTHAGVAKSVASKIKNNPDYTPSKLTALAFAVSLRLPLRETERLLASFGASFSPSNQGDMIIRYFIAHARFDPDDINSVLYDYDQPLLPMNYFD